MKILFYDVGCPIPYTNKTLEERALGGTEATVIRIAHALKNFHTVYVAQHNRSKSQAITSDEVHYIALEQTHDLVPDAVILLNYYQKLAEIGNLFPQAKLFFWMHNVPSIKLFHAVPALIKYQFTIIAVSYFHKSLIQKRLQGKWYNKIFQKNEAHRVPIHVLYNPLAEYLINKKTNPNPNQLIFVSSQHKGLSETLKIFGKVSKHYPNYELFIANPGYKDLTIDLPKKTFFLGALPHQQVIEKVRESFCVFYPQSCRLETFGLVYAEANAVGTPVLAHDFGPAREVLTDPSQLVDGNSARSVLAKLGEWQQQRPLLYAKPAFRLDQVTHNWLNLFTN